MLKGGENIGKKGRIPIVNLPDRKYNTIVVDPPWKMKKMERDIRPEQVGFDYKTMPVEEISTIPIPNIMSKDSFCFIWTTQKYLPYTFSDILPSWGLKYRFTMVWFKNGGVQPFNLPQFDVEFVVCGVKGNPQLISQKRFPTGFYAKRKGHSVKPENFYEMLRRCTPEPRIDIFNRRVIKGFDGWGDESPVNNDLDSKEKLLLL